MYQTTIHQTMNNQTLPHRAITAEATTAKVFTYQTTTSKTLIFRVLVFQLLSLLCVLCQPASSAVTSVTMEPPVLASDAAIDWQWIGLKKKPAAPCPQPAGGNWSVADLFTPAFGGGGLSIPPALRPFCIYWQDNTVNIPPAELAFLQALVPEDLTALERDSLSVTTNGAIETAVWEDLASHFLAQAGASVRINPKADATQLAVIDTAQTAHSKAHLNEGTSPHGYTLLNLARALLCDGNQCVANITSSLAMPFRVEELGTSTRVVRDIAHGGEFGSVAEVARGLQREVAYWTSLNTTHRLVLNLSLGWDPVFGGSESVVSDLPLAVQAVYWAIFDARCRGGLIVAAAGNSPGGQITSGPLFPAAWEQRRAPHRVACGKALGYKPRKKDFPTSSNVYNPLVFAAAGIQVDGGPLPNQRPGASAALAAFADHAVAEGSTPGTPTAVLTGSSVASLVVSSAAAQIWHHLPKLRADEVMAHLYRSGDDLGRKSDFGLTASPTAPPPQVRRISLCAARNRACRSDGPCGFPISPCTAWNPDLLDLSSTALTVFEDGEEVDLSLQTAEQTLPSECQSRSLFLASSESDPADPCPDLQYRDAAAAPWRTDPQPGSTFCPSCPLSDSGSTLYIETDASDSSAVWRNPMLVLCETTYSLGVSELTAGEVLTVTGVNLGSCTEVSITATSDYGSVTSPVLIVGSGMSSGS